MSVSEVDALIVNFLGSWCAWSYGVSRLRREVFYPLLLWLLLSAGYEQTALAVAPASRQCEALESGGLAPSCSSSRVRH
jgi:hypothetical protein